MDYCLGDILIGIPPCRIRDSEKRIGIPKNVLHGDELHTRIRESPIDAMELLIGDLFCGIEMH